MSQEKVEKRKYEKKNREKLKKQHRTKLVLGWATFGIVAGIILAGIFGPKIYNSIPKYIEAEKVNAFVTQTWVENGYNNLFTAADSDTDTDNDVDADNDTDADTDNDENVDDNAE